VIAFWHVMHTLGLSLLALSLPGWSAIFFAQDSLVVFVKSVFITESVVSTHNQ